METAEYINLHSNIENILKIIKQFHYGLYTSTNMTDSDINSFLGNTKLIHVQCTGKTLSEIEIEIEIEKKNITNKESELAVSIM